MNLPTASSSALVPPPLALAPRTVLLLIGPPGCGKGTQAAKLTAMLRVPAISTGEMIRAEIGAGTELGKIAQGVTITGGLLGDDIINRMVESRLQQPDCANGFLLDGYPRSLAQARFLSELLPKLGFPQPQVIHVDVHFDALISRTCMRRYCPDCGEIYNLVSKPPQCNGVCDADSVPLKQRADDCEDTVRNRLSAYEKITAPILDFYSNGQYHRIDGDRLPDVVFDDILRTLPRA